MKPTVVIGYPGFGDIEIEEDILRTIDANVVYTAATDTTRYWAIGTMTASLAVKATTGYRAAMDMIC